MTAATTEDPPRRKGDEIRAKIEANRRKRLNIAEAMKIEAGVDHHIVWAGDGEFAGLAFPDTGLIKSPEGRKILELWTVAHECGHIFLHRRGSKGYGLPSHVKEMEAESYAHQAFVVYGMRMPRKFTAWGRHYVGTWVAKDRAAGIKIDPRVEAYVAGTRSPYEPLRDEPPNWKTGLPPVGRRRPRVTHNARLPAFADPDYREPIFRRELRELPEFILQTFCLGFTLTFFATILGLPAALMPEFDISKWATDGDWRQSIAAIVGGLLTASLAMIGRTLRR